MKKGFTLAEVLITLTIIGVIAALTIPNLMQSYKKHQVEVGVKEAYSILSNALKMGEAENGNIIDSGLAWSDDFFIPYLKIAKTCNKTDKDKYSCFATTWKDVSGDKIEYAQDFFFGQSSKMYILANGMSLTRYNGFAALYFGNDGVQINFAVDLNGPKGPNQIGNDIFFYTYRYNHPYQKPLDKPIFQAGQIRWQNVGLLSSTSLNTLMSSISGGCNLDAPTSSKYETKGALCGAAIQKNGWKIPDDYPIKKF